MKKHIITIKGYTLFTCKRNAVDFELKHVIIVMNSRCFEKLETVYSLQE